MSSSVPDSRQEQLQNMASTVWTLERIHRKEGLSSEERINLLRTHYEIQRLKEEDLEIPERDRSFLYLQEEPTAAVLLVPGGHSTPAQYFHLGRHLYRSGMTVYSSLLPNEVAVGGQKGGVPWQLTLAELEMHYTRLSLLKVPIHVVGSSFGSILAIMLAHQHNVRSLTLLSSPLRPHLNLGERIALTWGRLLPRLFERLIAGSPHRWQADRYGAVRQSRQQLAELLCPLLAIHAADNTEVSSDSLKAIQKIRGNDEAKTLLLDSGGHLLLQGDQAKRVQKEVQDFIEKHQRRSISRDLPQDPGKDETTPPD